MQDIIQVRSPSSQAAGTRRAELQGLQSQWVRQTDRTRGRRGEVILKERIICPRKPILILYFVCQTLQPSAGIFNKYYINNVFIKQYFEPLFVNNFISSYIFINSTLLLVNISTLLISIALAIYSGSFKTSQWNDPAVTNTNEELNEAHDELCFILHQQLKMPESPCAPPALPRGHCSAPTLRPDANPRSHLPVPAPAKTPLYYLVFSLV